MHLLRLWIFALPLITLLSLSGCASLREAPSQTPDAWIQTQVIPDLTRKLTTLPIFKNQLVQVVEMEDGDRVESSNALTTSVRQQIVNALSAIQEVQLLPSESYESSTDLQALSCAHNTDVDILIGVESVKNRQTGKLSLSIQAYDAHDNLRQLADIHYTYTEMLIENRLANLSTTQKPAAAQGSRNRPFQSSEADLLAEQLSKQLACALSQHARDYLILYPVVDEADSAFLQTTTELTAIVLAEYRQIRIADTIAEANSLLHLSAAVLEPTQRLSKITAHIRVNPKLTADEEAIFAGAPMDGPATATAYAKLDRMVARVTTSPAPAFAFTQVRLITPVYPADCTSHQPWQRGENQLGPNSTLIAGQCFAIEATVNKPATLFMIYQTPQQSLQRMLPSQCSLFSDIPETLDAFDLMRFPTRDGNVKALDLGNKPGTESFFIIATQTAAASKRLTAKVNALRDFCEGTEIADNSRNDIKVKKSTSLQTPTDFERWLEVEAAASAGQLIWQKRQFSH